MYFILPALDQFSQQNTHCRTAILQNSSLGAPTYSVKVVAGGGGGEGGKERVRRWLGLWVNSAVSRLNKSVDIT